MPQMQSRLKRSRVGKVQCIFKGQGYQEQPPYTTPAAARLQGCSPPTAAIFSTVLPIEGWNRGFYPSVRPLCIVCWLLARVFAGLGRILFTGLKSAIEKPWV